MFPARISYSHVEKFPGSSVCRATGKFTHSDSDAEAGSVPHCVLPSLLLPCICGLSEPASATPVPQGQAQSRAGLCAEGSKQHVQAHGTRTAHCYGHRRSRRCGRRHPSCGRPGWVLNYVGALLRRRTQRSGGQVPTQQQGENLISRVTSLEASRAKPGRHISAPG